MRAPCCGCSSETVWEPDFDSIFHPWTFRLGQLSWQHDWRPVPRDSDYGSDWAPTAGRAGVALLLYLQIGHFSAVRWTWNLLRVTTTMLVIGSEKWKQENTDMTWNVTLDFIQHVSRFLPVGSFLLGLVLNPPQSSLLRYFHAVIML